MRLMKNKMTGITLGIIGMFLTFIVLLVIAFLGGAAGLFSDFIDGYMALFVLGLGWSMTFLGEHTIGKNQYGKVLKENLILSGWIGFMIGIMLFILGIHEIYNIIMTIPNYDLKKILKSLGQGVTTSMLSIIYGYLFGKIFEAIFTEKVNDGSTSEDNLIQGKSKNIVENLKVNWRASDISIYFNLNIKINLPSAQSSQKKVWGLLILTI